VKLQCLDTPVQVTD